MTDNGQDNLEFDLDTDLPLGDGTAELSAVVTCPYCAEQSEVGLDPGSGADQAYVEDCPVCCQPWSVHVTYARDGSASVVVSALE
jgi:hypothetical protein